MLRIMSGPGGAKQVSERKREPEGSLSGVRNHFALRSVQHAEAPIGRVGDGADTAGHCRTEAIAAR